MAAKHFHYLLITSIFLKYSNVYCIYVKIPEIEDKIFNATSHLENAKVKIFCKNRVKYCRYNGTDVCSFRKLNNIDSYKDFENSCYLFMSNMCDYPGEEFHIISSGSCENYLAQRRNEEQNQEEKETQNGNNNEHEIGSNKTGITEIPVLRDKQTISTLYAVSEAYDGHPCPYSCPNTYSPECVNVNKGYGKYFKLLTFVNHCMADMYYCQHYKEFAIPPDLDEAILSSSPINWSYCGASRYLQFSRFVEVTSSMGHYGWLSGNYRYSHIMEPHERLPGMG